MCFRFILESIKLSDDRLILTRCEYTKFGTKKPDTPLDLDIIVEKIVYVPYSLRLRHLHFHFLIWEADNIVYNIWIIVWVNNNTINIKLCFKSVNIIWYDTIRKIICKRSLTDQYPLRECRAASSQKSTRAKHI